MENMLLVFAYIAVFAVVGALVLAWAESENAVKRFLGRSVVYIFFGGLGLVFLLGITVALAKVFPLLVRWGVAGVIVFLLFRHVTRCIYGEGAWRFIAGLTNDYNGETEEWRRKIGENARWIGLVAVVAFGVLQWLLGALMEATMDDAELRFFEMGKYSREAE